MKTHQHRPGTVALLATVFLIALFSFQCIEKPLSPVAPNWDTQLSVPLLDSTYHLAEAMSTNPGIVIQNGGYVYQPQRFQYDPTPFGEKLQLFPQFAVQLVRHQVGNVSVPLPSPVTANVTAGQLLGAVPPGKVVQPPFGPAAFPSGGLPPLLEIDSVQFATGTMGLTIHNGLPIPISFPAGFQLQNAVGGSVVASFPATTINPGDTWTPAQSILNGIVMRNQLVFSAQVQSAGSGTDSVSYDAGSQLTISYTFNAFTLSAASGTTFTPFEGTSTAAPYIVDDSTSIQEVSFKSGKLRVRLHSNLNAAATANVRIEQLRNAFTDQPLSFDVQLNGSAVYDSVLDMREWKIKAAGGALTKSLDFSVTLRSLPITTSGNHITIHSTDFIQGELLATEVPFDIKRLAGVLRTLSFDIDQSVPIPLGTFSSAFSADSIYADSIGITLHVGQPGHPVDLALGLVGHDESGNVIATLPRTLNRVNAGADGQFQFPSDLMAQFLSQFISRHGTEVEVIGQATLNPADVRNTPPPQIADLRDTSNLYLGLDVLFPLRAGVIGGKITDLVRIGATNSSAGNTGGAVDKDLLTSVTQASVFMVVDNAIPVGVNLKLDFLNAAGDTILTLPKPGQPAISIAAGTVGSPMHSSTPIAISISPGDAQKFGDAEAVGIAVGLNTGGTLARFTPQDYIHVRAYSNMVFNVNPDKLKNK